MPIYAYRCESCGFAKDALQKVSDAPLTDCPSCGKPALKKQVTAAGFQLKGTGWYVTDFRGNGGATVVPPVAGAAGAEGPATPAVPATPAKAGESAAPSTPASAPAATDSKPAST